MSATRIEARDTKAVTFVVAVSSTGNWSAGKPASAKRSILETNFLASPCLQGPHPHQILLQEDFPSAGRAYNDAIEKSVNDLIVFCHQDMFFPEPWISQLQQSCDWLDAKDPNWGVLGCSGITPKRQMRGYVYSPGLGIVGNTSEPGEVQTLDEIVLAFRKSSGLRFDENLPHFHFYGADICLRAAERGMKSYAISAFCIHNTYANFSLPSEFYECCGHIRRVWKKALPIQTTCVSITRSNLPVYMRRLRQFYVKHIRREEHEFKRVDDVRRVFEEISGRI
jgi:hypothetical protein